MHVPKECAFWHYMTSHSRKHYSLTHHATSGRRQCLECMTLLVVLLKESPHLPLKQCLGLQFLKIKLGFCVIDEAHLVIPWS